jgi:hypothetical protein
MERQVACIWKMINLYKILVRKLQRKRQLGRMRCGWKDYIEMELGETGMGMCEMD